MIQNKLVEGLSEQMTQLLKGVRGLPGQEQVEQQMQFLLQGAFSRLDLVTREEFDAQSAVLARTRARLEALEDKVAQLEQLLVPGSANTHPSEPVQTDQESRAE
ncbi:accessory factor UbiK family protein [Nitrincola sp. MINF-07-Sa-05]|uniref:accessory factor UbiK family protein n=1 Tax=Nitrincola salilacus TaxID=3400273 RepID=UPI003917FADB